MAGLAPASAAVVVSPVDVELVTPMPVVAIAKGGPPAVESPSVMQGLATVENNLLGEFPKTSVHPLVDESICPLVDELMSHPSVDKPVLQSSSEKEQLMDDIGVVRGKKEKKRVIPEEKRVKDMSNDDLMKISQKRKSTDLGGKNKSKKQTRSYQWRPSLRVTSPSLRITPGRFTPRLRLNCC